MSRPLSVRKPSINELRRLHRWLEGPLQPWQRRRAEVLLLHAAGRPASAMAQLLQVHVNTVYADLRDFAQHGLSFLHRPRRVGAPPRLSQGQIDTIWRLASQPPTTLGLPFGRWTVAKLRDYLIRQRIVKAISREHLRRVLKKGGYALRRIQRKLFNTDPHRRVILHRLRRWWQHRPRGAILAFFDVKPIAVKAYGGRGYTKARRLVLQRNQKTRGRFYLFLLYEVNHGRVHWAFFPGKGGRFVRQFLRRVRQWYPRQPMRLALDRDPAHPIKDRACQ